MLGFDVGGGELISGHESARLEAVLAALPPPATIAEVICVRLRTAAGRKVYWHEGSGAFDAYDVVTASAIHGIEVKRRHSKFPTDLTAWGNKVRLVRTAADGAGVAIEPCIEQVVLDERSRATFLVLPGIVPQGRAFEARLGWAVSTQLARYVWDRLELRGGTVLLRDVPAEMFAGWEAGEPIAADIVKRYRANLLDHYTDERKREMARRAIATDTKRINAKLVETFMGLGEVNVRIGIQDEVTDLYQKIIRCEAAEAEAVRAEQRAIDFGELAVRMTKQAEADVVAAQRRAAVVSEAAEREAATARAQVESIRTTTQQLALELAEAVKVNDSAAITRISQELQRITS